MKTFLSDLPLRTLVQYDRSLNCWHAWRFDGVNQIGDKVGGESKQKAIQNLQAADSQD